MNSLCGLYSKVRVLVTCFDINLMNELLLQPSSNPCFLYTSLHLFGSGISLNRRDHWLIYHVLECFGDVGALRTLRIVLDLHTGDEVVRVVLCALLNWP
jgi:hypothetical protein